MKTWSKAGLLVAGAMTAAALPLVGTASAAGALTNVTLNVNPVNPQPRQATVSWNADAGGHTIEGWKVVADPGGRTYDEASDPSKSHVFDNLTSNKDYRFTVKAYVDEDDDPNTAPVLWDAPDTFNVPGFSLGASMSRNHVVAGSATTFRGALTQAISKDPQRNQDVLIQSKPKGNAKAVYKTIATVKTGKGGAWSKVLKPKFNTKYRAIFTAKGMGSWTEEYDVIVSPALSIGFSRNPVTVGSKVTISGKVVKGSVKALSGQRVSLQRFQKGKWQTLRDLKISASGTFRTKWAPGNTKDYKYRWQTGGGERYGDGVSPAKKLVVN